MHLYPITIGIRLLGYVTPNHGNVSHTSMLLCVADDDASTVSACDALLAFLIGVLV
jgi:hypothetical protein